MESWRLVWRTGFAPLLSTKGLEKLQQALIEDDPRLIQGATTTPPPLLCVQDWPVEAACVVGYCGWHGDGLNTVGEVEEFFAKTCFYADCNMKDTAGCRWFLNWHDDTPRDQMRRELLVEVSRELVNRYFAEMYKPGADMSWVDKWWDEPNKAFPETPWAVLQEEGKERFDQMFYQMESGVAT